jgi:TolB-like protein/Tfp pilus assembly protein PilF
VLPFKNQSASAENAEFFAGGLHDELLTLLSKLGELRVISRTSVERLDPELTIPEIGVLLGVATVLEGQVQRAGDRLRINVQLIDTHQEGHLWANTYDSKLTAENVFDVQSDIARTIADALRAELSTEEEKLLAAVPTTNTAALEKYLLGAQAGKTMSFGAIEEAIGHLREATALDPGYVEAWTALAFNYSQAYRTGAISARTYIDAVEPAVRSALTLDASFGPAYTQQAMLQLALGDTEGAERSFKRALELDPHNPETVGSYAYFLRDSFRAEEAIPLLEAALVNDPLSTELMFQLGKAEMHSGRPERFLELAARIRDIDPGIVTGYTGPLQAYLTMGRVDLGLPWFVQSLEFDPGDYENWSHMAIWIDSLGDVAVADRYMARAEEIGPGKPTVVKCRVLIELRRGDPALALELSRNALAADLDDRWGSDAVFLSTVRDAAIGGNGNVGDILELYRERAPDAFAPSPEISSQDLRYAVDAVPLLHHLGEEEAADRMIAAALAFYDRVNPQRLRGYDFSIVDVELLALDGQPELALERLQEAVEDGWFTAWQLDLRSSTLDSIRERPEFREIVAQLESKTAEQHANWAATPHLGRFDLRDTASR